MLSAVLLSLEHILFNALFKLVNGFIFAHILGELIVKLGKLLNLYLVKLNLEYCVLGGKLGSVILRELNIDIEFITDAVTDNLILKAGNESTGADGQAVFFSLAAVKSNAVNKTFKINRCYVAVFNSSVVNIDNSCASVKHMLDFVVDFFFCNLCLGLFGGKSLISLESDFGLNGNIEGHNNAFFNAHCFNIKVAGRINGSNARLIVSR